LDGLKGASDIPDDALDYRAGRLLEKAGKAREALRRYRAIEKGVLSDEALFREGRILARLKDIAGARVAFAGVSRSSARWIDARLGLAESLTLEGRPSLALTVLNEIFTTDLTASGLHRARLALAHALAGVGQPERARDVALGAFLDASTDGRARSAATELAALGQRPSRLQRRLRRALHARGRDLLLLSRRAARHPKSMRALDPGLPAFIRGRYALNGARDAKLAKARLRKAVNRARDSVLLACSEFALARAMDRSGDGKGACNLYVKVLKTHPAAPTAAKAAMALSNCRMREEDTAGAVSVLEMVLDKHPESGLWVQASWRIALANIISGQSEAALKRLKEVLAHLDEGDGVLFGMAEKLHYFRGVSLLEIGRDAEGLSELRRVARSFPHSWFGVLAITRLAGLAEDRIAFASKTGGPGLPGAPIDTPGFTRRSKAHKFEVAGREVPAGPRVRGPLMLWRLGYGKDAVRELRSRAARGLLNENGLALLAALTANGRSPRGAMYSRGFVRGWPAPWSRDVFEAAYPRPFTTQVMKAAENTGLDPALIYAVMRTESNFNPRARSGAGARGIMQLMPRTARIVASRLVGKPGMARRLRSPGPNIRLGATFLAELMRHFRGHLPLVLAGYNAGAGAARSFRRRFGHLPTDVFVEAVPYPATAAFIKRVVGYAAGYRAMYDDKGRGPFMVSMSVPDSLGPFMEKRGKIAATKGR